MANAWEKYKRERDKKTDKNPAAPVGSGREQAGANTSGRQVWENAKKTMVRPVSVTADLAAKKKQKESQVSTGAQERLKAAREKLNAEKVASGQVSAAPHPISAAGATGGNAGGPVTDYVTALREAENKKVMQSDERKTAVRGGSFGGGAVKESDRGGFTGERVSTYQPRYSVLQNLQGAGQKGLNMIARTGAETLALAEDVALAPFELFAGQELGTASDTALMNRWAARIREEGKEIEKKHEKNIQAGGLGAEALDVIGSSTIAAAPQAIVAMMTGGGNLFAQSAAGVQQAAATAMNPGVVKTINNVVKGLARDPKYWSSFAGIIGTTYQNAVEEMEAGAKAAEAMGGKPKYDNNTIRTKAALMALGNALAGAAAEVSGGLEDMPEQLQKGGKWWKMLVDVGVDEGREEVIQGWIERGMENLILKKGNALASLQDAGAVFSAPAAAMEFGIGFTVGSILSGAEISVSAIVNKLESNLTKKRKTAEIDKQLERTALTIKNLMDVAKEQIAGEPALAEAAEKIGRFESPEAYQEDLQLRKRVAMITDGSAEGVETLVDVEAEEQAAAQVMQIVRDVDRKIADIEAAQKAASANAADLKGEEAAVTPAGETTRQAAQEVATPGDMGGNEAIKNTGAETAKQSEGAGVDLSRYPALQKVVEAGVMSDSAAVAAEAVNAVNNGVLRYENGQTVQTAEEQAEAKNTAPVNPVAAVTEGAESNGTELRVPGDTGWRAGESAGESGGAVPESTGRRESRSVQNIRARDRADAVAWEYDRAGAGGISTQELYGNGLGAEDAVLRPAPRSVIESDEELRTLERSIRTEGYEPVFFTGAAMLKSGQPAPAYIQGKRVFIRIDHPRWTATQLWEHEGYHGMSAKNPGMVREQWNELCRTKDGAWLRETLKTYRDRYHGAYDIDENGNAVWNEDVMWKIVEEILADAYAGRDAFSVGVDRLGGDVRTMAEQRVGSSQQARAPPEGRFAFAGEKSATADLNALARAKEMDSQDVSAETIRQETGWFKGMDGKWRYEIDDSKMRYERRGDLGFRQRHEGYDRYRELNGKAEQAMLGLSDEQLTAEEQRELTELRGTWGNTFRADGKVAPEARPTTKLTDYIDHPELFAAYPELESASLVFDELPEGTRGQYDREQNTIRVSEKLRHAPQETLLHEIQHAVQQIEDFTGGASVEYWEDQQRAGRNKTRNEGAIKAANQRYRDLFDAAPEELRQTVRKINQAKMAGDWDAVLALEDEIYDGPYADTYSELGDADFDRRTLIEQNEPISAKELYRNTAGEIEARDTGKRRGLTADERKKTAPDLGGKDTVFAESESRFALDGSDEKRPWWEGEDEEIRSAAEMMTERNKRDPAFDIDEYLRGKLEEAEQERANRLRNIPKSEFKATENLEKLGVKVEGSVARYDDVEQIKARHRAAQSVMRELRKTEKRLNATAQEKLFAGAIAGGTITEDMIPANVKRSTVMELADYYMAERAQGVDMIRQRRTEINKTLDERMRRLFKGTDKYKVSPILIMNNRTPQRNMLKIFGGEMGRRINEEIFDPVATNEAERIRFVNREYDKVRTFTDSEGKKSKLTKEERALVQMVIEGRAVEEIVAGMEIGGAIKYAAENIAKGGDAGNAAKQYGLDGKEQDLAVKYAGWLQAQEALHSGKVDNVKVENAANTYSDLFDQYYDAINDFLVVHGYEPIGFIKGYAPHLQPEENSKLLDKALEAMGVNRNVTNLPAEIAGKTSQFRPNKRWNPYFLQRTGDNTEYDIATAFESYIDHMSDVLYHTDDIMRIRRMERFFRRTYSKEELRNEVEWAEGLRNLKPEEKLDALKEAGKISRSASLSPKDVDAALDEIIEDSYSNMEDLTRYGEFVMWLENYANILAGKQSMVDRGGEAGAGRRVLNWGNALTGMFGKAQVAGNLSSVLNQTSQLPMILAENGSINTLLAAADMMTGQLRKAGFAQESDILTSKNGVNFLVYTPGEMAINAVFTPAQWMDSMISTLAVRGAYLKAVKSGKSHAEAMKTADRYGRNVMGSREKGVKPLGFSAKNPMSQLLHVFQLEVLNNWEHIGQDLPADFEVIAKQKGKAAAAAALAGVLVKSMLSAFLLNRLTEEVYGGTPAPFDILGMTANFIASGEGLSTNEWLMTMIDNATQELTGERIFDTEELEEGGEFDLGTAAEDAWYNVSNEIPFFSNASSLLGWGDQTLPWPDVVDTGKDLAEAIKDDGLLSGATAQAAAGVTGEFLPGGRQMVKSIGGIQAAVRGGKATGFGEDKTLQFPTAQTPANIARQVLFGVNATPEARSYWVSGESKLSAKQTQLWERLVDGGANSRDVYDVIQSWRNVDSDKEIDSERRGKLQRNMVSGMDMTDNQKLDMYRTLSGADSRCDKFQAMMNAGISWEEVMAAYDKHVELEGNKTLKATEQAAQFVKWAYSNLGQKEANAAVEQLAFWTTMKASPSQKDLEEQLNRTKLTDTQKDAVWNSYGWKKKSPWS